jgi:hypothetical protein
MAEYVRTGEERLRELKKRFDFLDALIAGISGGITAGSRKLRTGLQAPGSV